MSEHRPETLLDFARQPLSAEATYTIEMLIDYVWPVPGERDYEAEAAKDERRREPDYVPHFDFRELEQAYPLLMARDWLNLQDSTPPIVDLSPLAYMTNLTGLCLKGNKIANISAVAQLKQLRRLYLYNNPIKDLTPLAALKRLEDLSITTSMATDFAPLSELPYLRELTIKADQLSALSSCERLPALEQLNVEKNFDTVSLWRRFLTRIRRTGPDFTKFPEMPRIRELSISDVASFEGIQRFSTLCNLTNISGEFDDLTPLSALPDLTNFNALRCNVRSLEPVVANQELRSFAISTDKLMDVTPLYELPKLHYVSVDGERVQEGQVARLENSLSSWDTEFKAESPQGTPSLELFVVEDEAFDFYDTNSFGVEGWNGDRSMLLDEAEWLQKDVERVLSKELTEDDDFVVPFRVRYARSFTVCLYSEASTAIFRDVALMIQNELCWAKNEWIVYFQSDMHESGSDQEDFVSWLYRDKIVVNQKNVERVRELLG